MTISTTTNRVSFAGNGSTTAFATGFKFFADSDLIVTLVTDSTGAEVAQVITTDYTVSGAGVVTGGTVTMVTAPAVGETLVIVRNQPYTQGLDLVENDPFPSQSVEDQLDKLAIMAQQNESALDRSLRQAEGDTADIGRLPAKVTRASKVLGFDADGDPEALTPNTSAYLSVSPFMETVLDDTTAAAARTTLGAAGSASSVTTAMIANNAVDETKMKDALIGDFTEVTVTASDSILLGDADDSGNTKRDTVQGILDLASGASIVANSRNLVAAYATAATADIDADEVVLKDSSGAVYLAESVNLTVNIGASGANGLDTGSEASGTWYYLWVIYNGTTVAGLISASATSPTLPSGYTYKALVGAVRNDGSSDFIRFWQSGRRCSLPPQVIFTSQAGQTSYGSQSISAAVPPVAVRVQGTLGQSTGLTNGGIAVAGDANGVGACYHAAAPAGTIQDNWYRTAQYDVPLITDQTVYWKSVDTASTYRLSVAGFDF